MRFVKNLILWSDKFQASRKKTNCRRVEVSEEKQMLESIIIKDKAKVIEWVLDNLLLPILAGATATFLLKGLIEAYVH